MENAPIVEQKPDGYWKRNKTKILAGTTIALGLIVVLQNRGLQQHNQFLKKHGLYEEYYFVDDLDNNEES